MRCVRKCVPIPLQSGRPVAWGGSTAQANGWARETAGHWVIGIGLVHQRQEALAERVELVFDFPLRLLKLGQLLSQ